MNNTLYSSTALTPLNSPTLHKGGLFKAALGIAIAVAIPFAAPAIAASIGSSLTLSGFASAGAFFGSAGVGTLAGSALVGAGVGGLSGYALGGKRGAIMGALGGGVGGFAGAGGFSGIGSGTTTGATGTTTGATLGATPATGAGLTSSPIAPMSPGGISVPGVGGVGGMSTTPALQSAVSGNQSLINYATSAAGGGAGGLGAQLGGGYTMGAQGAQSFPAGTMINGTVSTAPVSMPSPVAAPGGGFTGTSSTVLPANAPVSQRFTTGVKDFARNLPGRLSEAGGKIAETVTDPKILAERGMQLGAQYLGSALTSPEDVTSPEERALMEQQRRSLTAMEGREGEAYALKMQGARDLIAGASYYNPEDVARRSVAASKAATSRATQAGLRRISPSQTGLREAEARRYALSGARSAGTAYDRGIATGAATQAGQTQAGLAAIPSAPNAYLTALTSYGTGQADIYGRLRKQRENAASWASGFIPT